jgi:NADH-quinone oxidoreductase subunit G
MSSATAKAQGVSGAATVRVIGPRGSVEVPLELGDVAHDTVWLPMHSPGCSILLDLGARPGDIISVERGASA